MSAAALVVGMLIYVSAISCVSVTKCKEKILRKVSSFGSYFYVQYLKSGLTVLYNKVTGQLEKITNNL